MDRVSNESPISGSPDGKLESGYHETRVEKLSKIETNYEIDPEIEKRVTRKCDRHIIPWLFGIW